MAIGVLISNGCKSSNGECDEMKEYVSELVESIYNEDYVTLALFPHNLDGDAPSGGNRKQVLERINQRSCGDEFDQVDYDVRLDTSLEALNDVEKNSFDERKGVMMAFCDAEINDNSCDVGQNRNRDGELKLM